MSRSTKLVVSLWILVALTFGYLAGFTQGSANKFAPNKTIINKMRIQKAVADENGVDAEKKTFPLNKKFPDLIVACHTPEAAHQLALSIKLKDEAVPLIARLLGCFDAIVPITYHKLVEAMKTEEGTVNIYAGTVGSITVFVLMTDWRSLEQEI